jgi:hypothetical protein
MKNGSASGINDLASLTNEILSLHSPTLSLTEELFFLHFPSASKTEALASKTQGALLMTRTP